MSDVESEQRGELLLGPRAEAVIRYAGPVLVAVAGLLMLRLSWAKWPDVLIDFGQQLYLPWQVAEGRHLYSDLAYYHGPLAQYLNALWLRLFGTGFWTLVGANLVVLGLIVILLYRLLLRVSSALGAAAAGVVFMVMFAFAQLTSTGNYNYVAPYEHSVTYGMLASLAALWLAARFLDHGRLIELAGVGACLGLAFLTKAEIFLAAACAVLVGLGLSMWARRPGRRGAVRIGAVVVGTLLLPPLVAVILLATAMPPDQALTGALGPWPAVFAGRALEVRLYRAGMGTLDVGASLTSLLIWAGAYGAVLALPAVGALKLRGRRWVGHVAAGAVFVGVAGVLVWNLERIRWEQAARPLPVVMAVAGLGGLIVLVKARRRGEVRSRLLVQLTMVTFAFVLLGKMILNARVYHYGFALAMPAALLLVVIAVDWVPAWITRSGGRGLVFGAAALAVLLVAVFAHLRFIRLVYHQSTHPVADGRDAFLADGRGVAVNIAIGHIGRLVGPDQTLAVFPEGAMLNYLARRGNPSPYSNHMPSDVAIWGEGPILDAYRENPPDFVMLVHKDTSEFGVRFFGRDYGQRISEWVAANYEPVHLIGAQPLQDDRFGMLLLRRADGGPGPKP